MTSERGGAIPPITVAVADSQRLFAEALVCALHDDVGLDVSGRLSINGRAIVREVVRRPPDVALIDFWISDMDGPAAARGVMKASPSTRVVFLAEFFIGPVQRAQAHAAGALQILGKDIGLDGLVAAVRAAAASPAPPVGAADGRGAGRLTALTAREIEVLQVLRKSFSLQKAAGELSITVGTMKNHIHSILAKTKVRTQVEAMAIAEEEGFISGL